MKTRNYKNSLTFKTSYIDFNFSRIMSTEFYNKNKEATRRRDMRLTKTQRCLFDKIHNKFSKRSERINIKASLVGKRMGFKQC